MKRRASQSILRLLVIMVMAIVMVTALATIGFAQENNNADKECYLTGDMNADGVFDNQDAYHALFSYMLPDKYSIERDWDINQDQMMDQEDAIALLYAYMLPDLYSEYAHVYEMVHDYFDPAWNWTETDDGVIASVTVQCACGEPHVLTEAEGVTVIKGQVNAPSCTQTGSESYTAMVTYEGETFTGSYSKVLSAKGHIPGEVARDEKEHYNLCANCGDKMNAASHVWKADGEPSAATCQVQAVQNYKCDCGAQKQENLGFAEHDYVYLEGEDVLINDSCCQYAKQYQCSVCQKIEQTDYYNKHTYIAVITKEADCQNDGVKTYQCTKCPTIEKTESIPADADKHVWNEGVEETGAIVYSCTVEGCDVTKKTVTATEDGTVSKEALVQADELKLGNDTSVSLGQTVKNDLAVQEEMKIEVGEADKSIIEGLLGDKKDQIEGITVYNFNMTVDGNAVTQFNEKITITMPYTLQPGEDADAISVWFIGDNGELESIDATYSDGFVTFQTDHFSYYTVTRLTPEERCAKFGHILTEVEQAATCTADGYIKEVCQRCSHEEIKEVLQATGHSYKETSRTEATCENFGVTVETCENCSHEKYAVERALGHNMQLHYTKKASCTEAGYEEYTCQNENCSNSYQVALAQLTHNYLKDESKTVAASCSAGGYDVYVCEHCHDEVKRNETTALGHDYSMDSAQWNEDKQNPAVTLHCDRNGCNATKELKANIFTKEASCEAGGIVEAIVSYNNNTFKKTLATDPMLGHKESKEWVTTEDTHYLVCENCGQKMDVATHNYDDGEVTEAPTCVDGGKKVYTCRVCKHTKEEDLEPTGKHTYDDGVVTEEPTCATAGTKTYTCSVCQKTITEKVEATGEHSYEDGKCVSCGKEQLLCSHEIVSDVILDVSEFDICEGFELHLLSCECGELQRLEAEGINCEFEEVIDEQEYSEKVTATCSKCGLVGEYFRTYIFTADPCEARYTESTKLTIAGQTVVECAYTSDYAIVEHPAYIFDKKVEVEHEGFCGMTLEYMKCACGKTYSVYAHGSCDWVYNGEYSVCSICGTIRRENVEEVKDGNCLATRKYITNYYNRDGELICSYDDLYISVRHDYEVVQYELYGESCEDGIKIWTVCKDCGEEQTDYVEGSHPTIFTTETDLTNANICASGYMQRACACGEYVYGELTGEQCDWYWYGYNQLTGAEIYQCRNCHATRTETRTKGDKDENCEYLVTANITYADAEGNVLISGYRKERYMGHNYETTWELKGSSCEDGVLINHNCKDCGYHDQYLSNDHEIIFVKEYDLEEYGICSGYLAVQSCACGQSSYAEFGSNCRWTTLENGVMLCLECGTEWKTTTTEKPLSQCLMLVNERNVLSYNGEELLTFQENRTRSLHRWIYDFELFGTSCEEGYSCTQTCTVCGDVQKWEGIDAHTTYAVERELMTNTGLCGDVELVTMQCPCGKNTGTNIYWIGNSCQFMTNDKPLDDGTQISVCGVCGAERRRIRMEKPVEGDPCLLNIQINDVYIVNGEEILRTSNSRYSEYHDFVVEYELMGESCVDGVKINEHCTRCDASSTGMIYDHQCWDQYIDLAEYGFCGGVIYTYSCPCGEESYMEIYNLNCEWRSENGYDENGNITCHCEKCGGTWIEVSVRGEDIDQCRYRVTTVHTFITQNGESIEFASEETHVKHDWVETYELMGQLCTDGVRVNRICANCGDHNSDYYENHYIANEVEYDLSEIGACGGTLVVSECYCGKNSNIEWNGSNCKWNHVTGGPDFQVEQCSECKILRRHSVQPGEKIGSCNRVSAISYTFYTLENEVEKVLLNVSFNELHSNHRYLHSFELEEGATCMDHYLVYQSCADCNYTSRWGGSSKHETLVVSREPLAEGQLCGKVDRVTKSCPCGEVTETGIDWVGEQCQFVYQGYDRETGANVYVCGKCKVEKHIITTQEKVEGATCEYLVTEQSVYYKDGVELFRDAVTRRQSIHLWIVQMEKLGEHCDDGYYYREVCASCGELGWEDPNVRYGCSTVRVKRELLVSADVGICGDLYWDTYSCACGERHHDQRSWGNGSCNMESVYDEQTGMYLYSVCKVCGVREVTTRTETPSEDLRCEYTIMNTVSFLKGEELLYSYDQQETSYNHRYIYVYHCNGDSCEDGYTYDRECIWCDDVEKGTEIYYGHDSNPIEIQEIFRDSDDICGEVMLYTYDCACGKQLHHQVNHSCQWEQVAGEQNIYRCVKCGLTYEDKDRTVKKPGTCEVERILERVYTTADGVVGNAYHKTIENDHVTVYSVKGDCENGYLRTGYCVYCEELTEQDEELRFGHDTHLVEYYDLADYGMCGGSLSHYSCACGADESWGDSNQCQYNGGETNEDGAWTYHCDKCGTYHGNMSRWDHHLEDCSADATYYFKAVRDGEVLLHITDSFRRIQHTWVAVDYEGTCGERVTVYVKCHFCDKTDTHGYYGGHSTFNKEYIDLKDLGCCGGYIRRYGCICGEYINTDTFFACEERTYTGETKYTEEGIQYGYHESACKACGLTIRNEWYDVATEEPCQYERISTITVSKNGALLHSYGEKGYNIYHVYGDATYSLVEGATSCTDGVVEKKECRYCGEKEEATYYYHRNANAVRYDLAEMGSVCGGSFVRYSCVCGEFDYAQFDDDCACDLHPTDIECWVEGVAEGNVEDMNGSAWLNNYGTKYTCAQTDPKCAFTARMTYCWLVEDCVATRYQIWQLGYDEKTGTYAVEIRIPQKEQHAYHNFEKTENYEDGEDSTYISIVNRTCKDCQSVWNEECHYANGNLISKELLVTNKLENFEERRYELTEYALINNCYLKTKTVRELKKIDGTDESRVDTYSYDFTNGCYTTHVWSVNGGVEQSEVIEHFEKDRYSSWSTQPGCTQSGINVEWTHCPTCNQDFDRQEMPADPYGHNWQLRENGSSYYCTRCGLENSNGADGIIVLEDMTAQYGNGENYVVGYWNRGEDIFNVSISIVLDDGTEILLDDVAVTMLSKDVDGINAISVSGDAVDMAAQKALGTIESYDVRITLVPNDDSVAWDYAITLDGGMA